MLRIYGSMLCRDCVQCRRELDEAGIPYEFLDFSEDLRSLREFLTLREGEPVFNEARASGKIGIPCIVCGNGAVLLDWKPLLAM